MARLQTRMNEDQLQKLQVAGKFVVMARSGAYYKKLAARGAAIQFFGGGVALGDASQAICIIGKPQSTTMRTIFGDPSARDLGMATPEGKAIILAARQRMTQAASQR